MGNVNSERMSWWCDACRAVGLLHCSAPEYCGYMRQIPYHEAKAKYEALHQPEAPALPQQGGA